MQRYRVLRVKKYDQISYKSRDDLKMNTQVANAYWASEDWIESWKCAAPQFCFVLVRRCGSDLNKSHTLMKDLLIHA